MEGEAVPSDVNDTPMFMTPFRAMREGAHWSWT